MFEIKSSNSYIVDGDTGECHEIESGSRLSTPGEQKRGREYVDSLKQSKVKYDAVRHESYRHGGFTFLRIANVLNSLSPATAGRLAYLSTYVGYNNQLLSDKRTPITKTMLPDILGVGNTIAKKFYSECAAANLLVEREGKLYISEDFFRGPIQDKGIRHTKLYHDTVQDLYKRLPPKHHRYFGYVVQMLPWINVNYNIVCDNPTETDLDKINPIDVEDLYKICGYEIGNRNTHRFLDALTGAWFQFDGTQQALCALVVRRGQDGKHTGLVVNPHLMYMGTQSEKVAVLGVWFKPAEGKSAS